MSKNAAVVDPDLDDLDDLDDLVDDFDAPKPASQPPFAAAPPPSSVPASASAPSPASSLPTDASLPPGAGAGDGDEELTEAQLNELVEGMAQLLKDLEGADATAIAPAPAPAGIPRVPNASGTSNANASATTDTGSAGGGDGDGGADDPFQRTVRQAMDRLRTSEANPASSGGRAGAGGSPDDPLEALLKQFGDALGDGVESGLGVGAGAGGAGGEGGDAEDAELQGMLETMMRQLMSKDVLYEPLKELSEKFPAYLEKNASTLPAADKERYEQQYDRVTKIVAIFERTDYKDGEETTGEGGMGAEVVRLMNEMQSFGAPPTEIMGPMPPGLELGADGMPGLPEGCVIA